jgi:hypothetical protein
VAEIDYPVELTGHPVKSYAPGVWSIVQLQNGKFPVIGQGAEFLPDASVIRYKADLKTLTLASCDSHRALE